MRKYMIIWVGEVASTVGSALTSFALGVWIYERTDSVSLLTLNMLMYAVSSLVVLPLAGVAADRWNRKFVMVLGDFGVALCSLVVLLLATSGSLQIWHAYILTGASGAFGTFQWPAYKAAIPLIVPKEHLARASALSQVGDGLAELAGPFIAGALYVMSEVGLKGILLIDFATFAFSILIIVPIPRHKTAETTAETPASVIGDLRLGWQYIKQRPGLLALLGYFAVFCFFQEFTYPLSQPLLFETASPDAAGAAMSKMAIGMFVGIGIMTIWGGPKRRIHGILIPGILSGLAIALAGLRPSLTLITIGGFGYFTLLPIAEGSDQALWQTKVEEAMQGRVFAIQSAITVAVRPITLLLAGPLADHIFEPIMQPDGLLAASVGQIVGVGPGRGLGLFIVILGLLSAITSLAAYLYPHIRHVEQDLPDAQISVEAPIESRSSYASESI